MNICVVFEVQLRLKCSSRPTDIGTGITFQNILPHFTLLKEVYHLLRQDLLTNESECG